MKKNLASLAVISAMALSLVACGGNSGSSAPAGGSGSGGNDAASGDVVNLTIWQPSDKETIENWWIEKLDAWNSEHPEIQVHREAIDRSDSYAYDNKVATAVTSNDLPDILFVDGPQVSYYAANGIIVPLDSYFSADDLNDFVDSTVAECTYDGKLYAISATESSVALYYNKEYMKCASSVLEI